MRILYADNVFCGKETLKKLLVIGQQVVFLDGPPRELGSGGIDVGTADNLTPVAGDFGPVSMVHYRPYYAVLEPFSEHWFSLEINSEHFRRLLITSITTSSSFLSDLAPHLKQVYGLSHSQVANAFAKDNQLLLTPVDLDVEVSDELSLNTHEKRVELLRILAYHLSKTVSLFMLGAEEMGSFPTSDRRYILKVLYNRYAIGDSNRPAEDLSYQVRMSAVKSVIPREVIERASIAEIVKYREHTRDVYALWAHEMEQIAQKLENEVSPQALRKPVLDRYVDSQVQNRLIECRHAMEGARDKLFGEIMKDAVKLHVPSLALSLISGNGPLGLISLFKSTPAVIDFLTKRRELDRRNSMAYLLKYKELE